MRKLASVVVFALIAVAVATPSFAKEKAPQIIQFSNNWSGQNQNGKGAENLSIKQANEWLAKNFSKVRVISHSVSGNSGILIGVEPSTYHTPEFPVPMGSTGFSTVTILYEEK